LDKKKFPLWMIFSVDWINTWKEKTAQTEQWITSKQISTTTLRQLTTSYWRKKKERKARIYFMSLSPSKRGQHQLGTLLQGNLQTPNLVLNLLSWTRPWRVLNQTCQEVMPKTMTQSTQSLKGTWNNWKEPRPKEPSLQTQRSVNIKEKTSLTQYQLQCKTSNHLCAKHKASPLLQDWMKLLLTLLQRWVLIQLKAQYLVRVTTPSTWWTA